MNCQQIKDELLLYVGVEQLPDELQRHLNECAQCGAFYGELVSTLGRLGTDRDFYVDEVTVQRMVERVDEQIDQVELTRVTKVSSVFASWVPAAAAVILVVGMSFMVYMMGWFSGDGQQTAWIHPDSTIVDVSPQIIAEVGDDDMNYLFYGSAAGDYQTTGNMLLEEMTEEDLKYLDENFDVKDIL